MRKTEILQTTLGDLIAALSETALESIPNSKDAPVLVAAMLNDVLFSPEISARLQAAAGR